MTDEIREEAEKTLRAAVIDELLATVPEYSIRNTYSLEPSQIAADPIELLDNLLVQTEVPTYLSPVYDEQGNFVRIDEPYRAIEEMGLSSASMSLNRAPDNENGSVKGSSSNLPFFPGGFGTDLDNVLALKFDEIQLDSEDSNFLNVTNPEEFLTCPPGWTSGMPINSSLMEPPAEEAKEEILEEKPFSLDDADIFDLMEYVGAASTVSDHLVPKIEEKKEDKENKESEEVTSVEELSDKDETQEIQDILSTEVITAEPKVYTQENVYKYVNIIDSSHDLSEYKEIQPKMAKEYPFVLDPFQQASVVCMEKGESLFVAAHTSAGKTVVAEYATALCKSHKTRAIYTSPIKALSNQKFRDFKQIFEDVGLITGDIQLFPEAFCLVMTTEILRSMLYNGSEVIRDLEWVIFDEVHYINNAERGHVWEEVLIMLPAHVKIVMLSATVPNCVEFADWVGRIKNRQINVISTVKRPIPLEHFLYTGQDGKTKKDLFKIIDMKGEWLTSGYKMAAAAKENLRKPPQNNNVHQGGGGRGGPGGARGGPGGGRGGPGGGRGGQPQNRGGGPQQRGGGPQHRGGGGQPGGYRGGGGGGRGGPPAHGGNRGGGGGGNGGNFRPQNRNDKNVYINLIDLLRTKDLLPMVTFVFSRKRCDDNALLLSSIDLTTQVEKSHIHKFFAECIGRLKGSDKELPQVLLMRELCTRGFAVHHSGILPILKEVVELLFQKGYVKILFATETFAMGVNMPARTVVFDSVRKHDGTELRPLNAGEYIQMAGRAGRRGLDSTGTVIVLAKGDYLPELGELQMVMTGKAQPLQSKFRVTYSMLLNLLRVEQLRVEDMLQRSYFECASLREGNNRKNELETVKSSLETLPQLECAICNPSGNELSLRDFYQTLLSYMDLNTVIYKHIIKTTGSNKLMSAGRVIIFSSPIYNLRNQLAIVVKETSTTEIKKFLVFVSYDDQIPTNSLIDSFNRLSDEEKRWKTECNYVTGLCLHGIKTAASHESKDSNTFRVLEITFDDVVAIVKKNIHIDVETILGEVKLREIPRFRSQPLTSNTQKVLQQLQSLAVDWNSPETNIQTYDVTEDFAVNSVDLFESLQRLKSIVSALEDQAHFPARHCSMLPEHFNMMLERVSMEKKIGQLEYSLSSNSLLLSEEYQNRLKMLIHLGYVDRNKLLTFKGRVACEIHHQEVLIAELILENKLHTRSAAEVAAMLSATTCQYKKNEEVKFEKDSVFEKMKMDVLEIDLRMKNTASELKVNIVDVGDDIRFDLLEVVYHWANGMPFSEIMQMTEAQEGIIVRCIQRLSEVCKDVRNAAKIVGDQDLFEKMELVSSAIKRDIVFAASLYTAV